MSYQAIRSGFTGPSPRIGGSTEYHIDLKMLDTLPLAEKVKAFDEIAKQYKTIGRDIEFSNQNVSGARYDLNAPFDDRAKLIMQAAAAHGHSQHPGWHSLDFYAPFKGKSRFDQGAVEGASIYLPAIPGGKVRRGSGGDYGYYSEALNPEGQVVFRVGHGDINRPEAGDLDIVKPKVVEEQKTITTQPQESLTSDQFKKYMQYSLFQNLLNQQKQPTIVDSMLGELFQDYLG